MSSAPSPPSLSSASLRSCFRPVSHSTCICFRILVPWVCFNKENKYHALGQECGFTEFFLLGGSGRSFNSQCSFTNHKMAPAGTSGWVCCRLLQMCDPTIAWIQTVLTGGAVRCHMDSSHNHLMEWRLLIMPLARETERLKFFWRINERLNNLN